MTQVIPASLVAPTRAGQSVGYQIRAVDGTTIATAFTTTGVAEVTSTGYYRVNGGITAPDDGGVLEWYINNAGSAGAFLSAVAIEPAPNQADQAAGIRTALGLANPDLDTQLGNIPTTTEIWTHATRALTDAVTVGTINNNAITANSINSGAITNAKFAAGAIDAAAIASDAITAAKIADNAIDAGSIASGAITNAKFAAGAISATVVADNTITDTKIASGAITNTKFAAGAVDATAIATDAITATKIADNAIDGGALATNAIDKIQANLATQASLDTKASQASVNAIPTTPLLAANYTAPDNAGIAAIKAKTDNLPVDPADQSELAQLIAAIPQGLTTQQNTRLTQLWQQAGFDSAVPVVRDKEGDVITETIGTTVITHTATNAGDTVTTERQP
jgi:hypothetical protein